MVPIRVNIEESGGFSRSLYFAELVVLRVKLTLDEGHDSGSFWRMIWAWP